MDKSLYLEQMFRKRLPNSRVKYKTTAPAPEETPIVNTSDSLNTEQQQAVSDLQRVVAVIAGPGTGKQKRWYPVLLI